MKICPNCSAQNKDTDSFCQQCGQSIEDVEATTLAGAAKDLLNKAGGAVSSGVKKAQQTMDDMEKKRAEAKASKVASGGWDDATEMGAYASQSGAPVSQNKILVDPTEQITATIGNNYIQSFLTGAGVKRGCGILTDKRFYYKGKNFGADTRSGIMGFFKSLTSTTEEGAVSVDDITYTQFDYTRKIGLLLMAILLTLGGVVALVAFNGDTEVIIAAICWVAALTFFVMFFLKRMTIFTICFAGGKFGFDVRWYPISEFRDFQRQLHLMKDHRKEGAAV